MIGQDVEGLLAMQQSRDKCKGWWSWAASEPIAVAASDKIQTQLLWTASQRRGFSVVIKYEVNVHLYRQDSKQLASVIPNSANLRLSNTLQGKQPALTWKKFWAVKPPMYTRESAKVSCIMLGAFCAAVGYATAKIEALAHRNAAV